MLAVPVRPVVTAPATEEPASLLTFADPVSPVVASICPVAAHLSTAKYHAVYASASVCVLYSRTPSRASQCQWLPKYHRLLRFAKV